MTYNRFLPTRLEPQLHRISQFSTSQRGPTSPLITVFRFRTSRRERLARIRTRLVQHRARKHRERFELRSVNFRGAMGKGRFLKRLRSRSRRPILWEFGQMPRISPRHQLSRTVETGRSLRGCWVCATARHSPRRRTSRADRQRPGATSRTQTSSTSPGANGQFQGCNG